MYIAAYQYDNKITLIEMPDLPISEIKVIVVSGDEAGIVVFSNGDEIRFDAGIARGMNFFDGGYIVSGDKIAEWLNFTPDRNEFEAFSYQRLNHFDQC